MSMLGEVEIWHKLIESLREAEGAMTQMAFHRGDERWVKMATIIHNINLKAAELRNRRLAS